jgi:Flp pilus assembly protein TadG
VEFALVGTLLITLVFGIVDFGWMLNRDTLVNNASREGAREAAIARTAAAGTAAATASLTAVGITVGPGPHEAHVVVTCIKTSGSCDVNATTGATAPASGDRVRVAVTLDHRWITPVGSSFGSSIVLTKVTEMRIE